MLLFFVKKKKEEKVKKKKEKANVHLKISFKFHYYSGESQDILTVIIRLQTELIRLSSASPWHAH